MNSLFALFCFKVLKKHVWGYFRKHVEMKWKSYFGAVFEIHALLGSSKSPCEMCTMKKTAWISNSLQHNKLTIFHEILKMPLCCWSQSKDMAYYASLPWTLQRDGVSQFASQTSSRMILLKYYSYLLGLKLERLSQSKDETIISLLSFCIFQVSQTTDL